MTDCRLATNRFSWPPWLISPFLLEHDTQNKDANTTDDENICSDALLIQISTQITTEYTAGGRVLWTH